MKHTKGPWKVVGSLDGNNRICVESTNGTDKNPLAICDCTDSGAMDKSQVIANACLIAAAPEMYEALTELIKDCKQSLEDVGPCDHPVGICVCGLRSNIERAEAAIKQAEGRKNNDTENE